MAPTNSISLEPAGPPSASSAAVTVVRSGQNPVVRSQAFASQILFDIQASKDLSHQILDSNQVLLQGFSQQPLTSVNILYRKNTVNRVQPL